MDILNGNASGSQPDTGSSTSNTPWIVVPVVGVASGMISLLAWLVPLCGCPVSIISFIFSAAGIVIYMKTKEKNHLILGAIGLVLGLIGFGLTLINSILGAYLGMNGQLFK